MLYYNYRILPYNYSKNPFIIIKLKSKINISKTKVEQNDLPNEI